MLIEMTDLVSHRIIINEEEPTPQLAIPKNPASRVTAGQRAHSQGLRHESPYRRTTSCSQIQRCELISLFKEIGSVVDTYIPSHLSGRSGVFGFVLFKTVQQAATAVLLFNETMHFGRTIRVGFAQPKRWNREASSGNTEECVCNCHKKAEGAKGHQASDACGQPTRTQQVELSKKKKERGLSISNSFTFSFGGEERNDSNTTSKKRPAESKIKLILEQKSESKREKLENSWEKTGEKKVPDVRN